MGIRSRFGVFIAVKIQVVVFWVVTPYSHAVGYQRFGGPCFLHLQDDFTFFRNVGILPHHYMASQPKHRDLNRDIQFPKRPSFISY